jgi:dihydroflavonol-4-reductase
MRDVEVLFHAAASFTYGASDPHALEHLAIVGTRNVLQAAADAGVRRVVLTSSSVVFGFGDAPEIRDETATTDPNREGSYVRSKIRQDEIAQALAQELGLALVRACPTLTIGPHPAGPGASNGIVTSYLADPFRLTFRGGCNLVAADDVGEGHVLAAERGVPGEAYVLGAENLTWTEAHLMIAELAGVEKPNLKLDLAGAYAAAVAAEVQGRLRRASPLTTREQAQMVGRYYWYSHAKAGALGYDPRPIRPVLAETISFFAASDHVSRETRAALRLSPEVWAVRRKALGAAP